MRPPMRSVTVGKRSLLVDFGLLDEEMGILSEIVSVLCAGDAAVVEGIWELLAEMRACFAEELGADGDEVVYGIAAVA